MLLKTLFGISILFSICFVVLFFRTFKGNFIKILIKNYQKIKNEKQIVAQAKIDGKEVFHFENSNILIPAFTQQGALMEYKKFKAKERKANLKKV